MTGLLNKLSDRGYRITPQRRIILQVLSDSHRH
jgi:Fe2+ or Zn2+ uptake regulation protein